MKQIEIHQRVWAGVLACVLVLGWCQADVDLSRPASAVVQGVEGVVQVLDAQGNTRLAVSGVKLQAGDTLIVGTESTADLLLPETGATIGLAASSRLRFEELSYRDGLGGRLTRTLLDLQEGELLGNVDKQTVGSSFQVRMPNGMVSVRGTTFFINTLLNVVHVTAGVVNVTVNVTLDSVVQSRTVAVNAGYTLIIPRLWSANESLNNFRVVRTPFLFRPQLLEWFAKHTRFIEKYEGENVALDYTARRVGRSHIYFLSKPVVSVY